MTSPTSRPEPVRLSTAEQAALSRIAAHEHDRDTRFAGALARGEVRGPSRGLGAAALAVLAATALVVGAFVVPGPWLLVVVAVAMIVVVPAGLVVWALRQGTVHPDHPRRDI